MSLINDFRVTLQSKFNEIRGLEAGKIISDDTIQSGVFHYGYEISSSVLSKSIGYDNDNMVLTITGYLTTKGDTLEKFDYFTDQICQALSSLNVKTTTQDITTYDTTRKALISGTVVFNTLDKTLR